MTLAGTIFAISVGLTYTNADRCHFGILPLTCSCKWVRTHWEPTHQCATAMSCQTREHTQPTWGTPLECLALVTKGNLPSGPTRHLFHKATPLRLEEVAAYIETNTERQNKETKECVPNKRTRQKHKKELDKTDINNLPDSVQNNDHRHAHETKEKKWWTQWELQKTQKI